MSEWIDWIKWNGGECPVDDGAKVDIKFRSESVMKNEHAHEWVWRHYGTSGDIVFYRLSGEQQSVNALGTQIQGDHYLGFKVQPVEFINANNLDFLQGSVIKYISRHKLKGKQADVEKAIHFCKLILELQYESAAS